MQHHFLNKLIRKELMIGCGISINATEVAEIYGNLGYDWLFIDTEHSPLDPMAMQKLLQALPGGCSGIIRVPDHQETTIKKALDVGPDGIIVPRVNTPDQALEIVKYARFAPLGTRGVGVSRANDYGQSLGAYLETANSNQALIFQAEHVMAVQNIDQILEVDGFDGILVGPFDLSASMGKPGQVEDPEVRTAIETIGKKCMNRGMPCGIFGASASFLAPFIDMGFRFVVAGMDVMHLAASAGRELHQLKG
jgi:2-dehydro-3-deoxyglucarate aldolase/4-hydroxy-2-oxoheptanedioate aldolase